MTTLIIVPVGFAICKLVLCPFCVNRQHSAMDCFLNFNFQQHRSPIFMCSSFQFLLHCSRICRFSVTKRGNNYYGAFYFLVDEQEYAYKDYWFHEVNVTPSGSATISLELRAGQTVRVENIGSSGVYGSRDPGFLYSWFTGDLLYSVCRC